MSDTSIQLIVGLGNPGSKYDKTRHNAGFWFVDELARRYQGTFRNQDKFSGEVCRLLLDGNELLLLKPSTFMNNSGRAVKAIISFYKLALPQVLVVHDEIDLPAGCVKLKRDGGHGGHNGLRDIMAHMDRNFWRLRLGVGHPGHRDGVIDYVLAKPAQDDMAAIMLNIDQSANLLPYLLSGDTERVMRELHTS